MPLQMTGDTQRRVARRTVLIAAALGGWIACGEQAPSVPAPGSVPADGTTAAYVGGAVCASCHAEEAERWRGSHHDLAMQEASPATVLGDFAGASFEHRGERFDFHQRGDRFFVETAGANGEVREFEVAYTFGIEPLQQHLVRLPGGRLQALGVAWDSRPADAGGQRWFHLQPEEPVPPGDVLHWTGLAGSWNTLCADCHSTNLLKGYRPDEDRYETTWSAPDVSCEACHGPGSAHVRWADRGAKAGDAARGLKAGLRDAREWRFGDGQPIAHRVPAGTSAAEIDTCAPCHSRRSRIAASGEPAVGFLDTYRPALLSESLYHPDGQILDEVYVWGSFVQSRMHAAGVVCSDCHDPHALRIDEPDAVCTTCHRSGVFAAPAHHHHPEDSAGASCVACHMPARTYMGVDARRDHGFRVPRPDLTESIGVPNACSGCHSDRPASWAAEATVRWYGSARLGAVHFGEVLHAGRRRAPGAAQALADRIQDPAEPAIVRATALQLLGAQFDATSAGALRTGLEDPDALVRMAAVGASEALLPEQRRLALEPMLADPARAVRIEAARALAPLRGRIVEPAAVRAMDAALAEYRAAQALEADRPESHVNLGLLEALLGRPEAAQREYETAIRLGPFFVPAYANLADLHRQQGRDEDGERVLRAGIARVADSADLHHALGLLLVRGRRLAEAEESLRRAAELDARNARYVYVYAVAVNSNGDAQRALAVLAAAHREHPEDIDLLVALATIHRDRGETASALGYARRLVELRPEDTGLQSLVREIEARDRRLP